MPAKEHAASICRFEQIFAGDANSNQAPRREPFEHHAQSD